MLAQQIIRSGAADLIILGFQPVCDPEFPNKGDCTKEKYEEPDYSIDEILDMKGRI